jgi:hypothetical protein
MCNVRYECTTIDNSLLEAGFEHMYYDNMGYCYKCKLCDVIVKSALDAWLHLRNYHNIKTLDDYKAYEELRKTINETAKKQEQRQEEDKKKQNDKKSDKIIIKKVVKPRPKTILDFLKGDKNGQQRA